VTPEQTAAAARSPVQELGGAFAESPKTLRRARELGLTGWAFYVAGRGGALGEVRAETVAAALGFIAADAVRDGWEAARRVAPPMDVAGHHLIQCCRWGEERLADYAGAARLVALAERVVRHADPAGLPLSPLEAILAGPEGEAGAVANGWQPPFPRYEPLIRKRIWADALTDRVAGQAYQILGVAERIELIALLDETVRVARSNSGEYPAMI
jgi:hypothetical protein